MFEWTRTREVCGSVPDKDFEIYMATSSNMKSSESTALEQIPCAPSVRAPEGFGTGKLKSTRMSILGLVRELTEETKAFVRQELKLAKTEMSEKLARLAKNAASVGIGGFIAYAGTIVLLCGLGFLAAWAIHLAGLDALLSTFLGLFSVGLLTVIAGAVFVFQGLAYLRKESMAPERTIRTLQELKGERPEAAKPAKPTAEQPKVSSAEMQRRVERTEAEMGETLAELGDRVSPRAISRRVSFRLRAHPYRSGLVALAAGLLSGWLVRRRFQHGS
jgi:ElaB/YqjD/DUF883 family membrane-anchored ribosome-binding protein